MPSSQRSNRSIYPPSRLLLFLMREAHTVVVFSETCYHDKIKKHKIIQQLYNVFPADKHRERDTERSSSTGAAPGSVTQKKKTARLSAAAAAATTGFAAATTSCKLQQLPMPPCKLKHRGNNHYQQPASQPASSKRNKIFISDMSENLQSKIAIKHSELHSVS